MTLLLLVAVTSGLAADEALPRAADLRPRFAGLGLTAKSQAPRGCCSLFAVCGVLEYDLACQPGAQPVRLSEEYLNWASHQTNGRRTDGSFFSDALNGLAKLGVCREDLMPYAAHFDPDERPSEAAQAEAKARRNVSALWFKQWNVHTGMTQEMLGQMKRSLAGGHPVALGMRWPNQERYDVGDVLQMPPAGEVFDGHSIILMGYRDDGTLPGGGLFLFRNHSGPRWRQAGHAWLPYAYVAAYGNDAVALRVAGATP